MIIDSCGQKSRTRGGTGCGFTSIASSGVLLNIPGLSTPAARRASAAGLAELSQVPLTAFQASETNESLSIEPPSPNSILRMASLREQGKCGNHPGGFQSSTPQSK